MHPSWDPKFDRWLPILLALLLTVIDTGRAASSPEKVKISCNIENGKGQKVRTGLSRISHNKTESLS